MSFTPRHHRSIAVVLCMALLGSATGAISQPPNCGETCPCCQSRAHGASGSCCRHETKQKSCCQHAARRESKRHACCEHRAPSRSGEQVAQRDVRAICLCGAGQSSPVLPVSLTGCELSELRGSLAHGLIEFAMPPASPLLTRVVEHPPGHVSALALRAELCCWRT